MEVQNLQPAAEGATDGIARAAGRTVVPRHQDPGVIDQKIVADGVTPPVIDRREHLDGIGGGQHPPEAFAVGLREAGLLSPEGNRGDQPDIGSPAAQLQHRFGGREVEPHGHTAQEGPETARVQLLQGTAQSAGGIAAVGAVAAESYGDEGIGDHMLKDTALARILQNFLLNSKTLTTMKNTGIAIVSLVGGMIIGSALTMLFTPQSGPEHKPSGGRFIASLLFFAMTAAIAVLLLLTALVVWLSSVTGSFIVSALILGGLFALLAFVIYLLAIRDAVDHIRSQAETVYEVARAAQTGYEWLTEKVTLFLRLREEFRSK